jgi:hypothetical protein
MHCRPDDGILWAFFRQGVDIMKPKIANVDQWRQGSVEIAPMRSFGTRIKNGLIGIGFLSAVGLAATMWSGCGGGQDATLTVTPSQVTAGGTVTITWKTSGFLGSVPWTVVSNPGLSGFPIAFTGNMSDSTTRAVTQSTTFTLSNVGTGCSDCSTVISKTVTVQ